MRKCVYVLVCAHVFTWEVVGGGVGMGGDGMGGDGMEVDCEAKGAKE